MSGYLGNLIGRMRNAEPDVRPRLRATFEPTPALKVEEIAAVPSSCRPEAPPAPDAEFPPEQEPRAARRAAPPDAEEPGEEEVTLLPPRTGAPELPAPTATPVPQHPRAQDEAELESPSRADADLRPEPAIRNATAPAAPGPKPGEPSRAVRPRSIARAGRIPPAARPSNERAPAPAAALPPVVRVTIGRVEVRANFAAAPAAPRPGPAPARKLSLEDYLQSRNGGAR